jgi:hypothetical protein
MQEHVLPYRQSLYSWTEKASEREESSPAVTENKKTPTPDVAAKSAVKPKVVNDIIKVYHFGTV